jgi:DNA-binding NarL/FixJ family response regulator
VANAGRHADPTRVEVRLRAGAEGLVLDVIDDGVGFAVEAGESRHGHFGLRGMPGMNGIETVRRLRTCDADARLLMLTSSENQEDIIAAIDAGASGDMTKGTRYGDLVAAVREVHDGGRPLGEVIARKLASRDRGGHGGGRGPVARRGGGARRRPDAAGDPRYAAPRRGVSR